MSRRIVRVSVLALILIFVALQFFQPDKINPPAAAAADFEAVTKPSPEVAAIVKNACRDCHSNNTSWPWYSKISPVSWAVADHVKEGRARLNFSEWNRLGPEMSRLRLIEACAEMKSGGMPLWEYRLMHSEAKLTNADIEAFCAAANQVPSQ